MTDYTYNTGNPIGSTDVRDGVDNLKSFDVFMNAPEDEYNQRDGVIAPTVRGAIKALGPVVTAWTFTTGGTLNYPNEAALNPADGNYYGWTGVFPKVVAPGVDPTAPGSGYVPRTDVMLRSELTGIDGANIIGVATYAQIRAYNGDATRIRCGGRVNAFDGAHGVFVVDDADTTSADDGGYCLVDALGRRWKRQHAGAVLVAWFTSGDGIADDSVALAAAVARGGLIIGDSSATYTVSLPIPVGSNTTVDLLGAEVRWTGVAPTQTLTGRDRGVFEMKGSLGSVIDAVATGGWAAGAERFPCTESTILLAHEFLLMSAGSLPDPFLLYMVQPSDSGVSNRITVDYRSGFDIGATNVTYRQITPIKNSVVKNFVLVDTTAPSSLDAEDISGVVMQCASNCHTYNVRAKYTKNPVVFTQYVSDCSAKVGSVILPQKTTGGKGYYVQWNSALRCHSEGLNGVKHRHINDFTTAAYCSVRDCFGSNTADGDFVTHGAYEHDLTYENTHGVMTFAGSGAAFGETAKNITITNHVGAVLRARTNVTNITIRGARVNQLVLNTVGLYAENIELFELSYTPSRAQFNNWSRSLGKPDMSEKPAVLSNCNLHSYDDYNLFETHIDDDEILINGGRVRLRAGDFNGGRITFDGVTLGSIDNIIVLVTNVSKLHFLDCIANNVGFRTATRSFGIDFKIDGGIWGGTNGSGAFFSNRDYSGASGPSSKWHVVGDAKINWTGADILETVTTSVDYNYNWEIRLHANWTGTGTIRTVANQTPMIATNNIFRGVTFVTGALGAARIATNNVTI